MYEAKNFEDDNSQAHVFNCKMPSSPQLDKHHRVVVELSNSQPSLSLDSGLGTETLQAEIRKNVTHQTRVNSSFISKAEVKATIKFPSSHDPIWKTINNELEQIIPAIFPDSLINSLTTFELSQTIDNWLHQFFLECFEEQDQHIFQELSITSVNL